MHWWGRLFSNLIAIICLSFYFVICMRLATKYKPISKGDILALNARSSLGYVIIALGVKRLLRLSKSGINIDLSVLLSNFI